jgi:biopolymer transport protein TolR
MFVDVGENKTDPVDAETLQLRVASVLKHKPETRIMVRGDTRVDYGSVVRAMVLLQGAGAPSIGLITEPVDESGQ